MDKDIPTCACWSVPEFRRAREADVDRIALGGTASIVMSAQKHSLCPESMAYLMGAIMAGVVCVELVATVPMTEEQIARLDAELSKYKEAAIARIRRHGGASQLGAMEARGNA